MLHKSEGAAILELERQKEDIKRLLTLLQSTEEVTLFKSGLALKINTISSKSSAQ